MDANRAAPLHAQSFLLTPHELEAASSIACSAPCSRTGSDYADLYFQYSRSEG